MASRIVVVPRDDGYYDSLDGVELKEGEHLHVRWPSGSVQQVEVRIDRVVLGSLRDGQIIEVPSHKAYFHVAFHGATARVYLAGWEAQRFGSS